MRGAIAPAPAEVRTVAEPAVAQGWTYLGPQRATVEALALSPTDPGRILAVLGNEWEYTLGAKLWESDSAGMQWAPPPDADLGVRGVVFDDQGRALAVSDYGLLEHTGGVPAWEYHQDPAAPAELLMRKVGVSSGPSPHVWVSGLRDNAPRLYRIASFDQPWVEVTPELPSHYYFEAIAASPTDPGSVAVAAAGDLGDPVRIWVTQDSGATWHERSNGLPNAGVFALRWEGERLYLAFGYHYNGASGLSVSTDLGLNWTQIYGGPTSQTPAHDVAADPANPDRIWAATWVGIHRSDDGGQTWEYGVGGTGTTPTQQLRFDAGTGQLWAGLVDHGVWVSSDGGDSFQARDHRLNALPSVSLAINPTDAAEVAASHQGLYSMIGQVSTSLDGGLAWNEPDHPYSHAARRVRFDSQARLYATLTGFSESTLSRRDGPGEWTDVGFPRPANVYLEIQDMNFGDNDDTLLLSGRVYNYDTNAWSGLLWRSGDAGQTWGQVLETHPDAVYFNQIERMPTPGGMRLFVHEFTYSSEGSGRVLASDDDGLTWFESSQGLPDWTQGAMCVGDDGLLGLVIEEAYEPRVYRSTDHGENWTRTDWVPANPYAMGTPFSVIHCPGNGQRMVLGGHFGYLWMSTDGGDSFDTPIATADTWGPEWVRDIRSSTIGMYVVHRGGVWVNTDLALPSASPTGLQVGMVTSHMRVRATLAWTGGTAQVDIRRNGDLVRTIANTGVYVDTVPVFLAAPGTTWQVCNAGTSECSASVSGQR